MLKVVLIIMILVKLQKSETNVVSLPLKTTDLGVLLYYKDKDICKKFIMKSLVEELLEYFNNTPKEVLKKDWEEIHSEYAYGVEVQKFIEDSKKTSI